MVSRLIPTSPFERSTLVAMTAVLHCFGGVSVRQT